jgi:hypothetical protein
MYFEVKRICILELHKRTCKIMRLPKKNQNLKLFRNWKLKQFSKFKTVQSKRKEKVNTKKNFKVIQVYSYSNTRNNYYLLFIIKYSPTNHLLRFQTSKECLRDRHSLRKLNLPFLTLKKSKFLIIFHCNSNH